ELLDRKRGYQLQLDSFPREKAQAPRHSWLSLRKQLLLALSSSASRIASPSLFLSPSRSCLLALSPQRQKELPLSTQSRSSSPKPRLFLTLEAQSSCRPT
ncbi:unnamed protein product, partial [Lota lota]